MGCSVCRGNSLLVWGVHWAQKVENKSEMSRALCWLIEAFLSPDLHKQTVQPNSVQRNMNLFVRCYEGQTWRNTLIQMCHSTSLLLLSSGGCLEWHTAFTISPLLESSITDLAVTAGVVFKGPGTWLQAVDTQQGWSVCLPSDLLDFQPHFSDFTCI